MLRYRAYIHYLSFIVIVITTIHFIVCIKLLYHTQVDFTCILHYGFLFASNLLSYYALCVKQGKTDSINIIRISSMKHYVI